MSSTLVPTLHYKDARAAIRFLVDGCGFTEKSVFEGESGRVEHAELVHGTGMVMLGTTRDSTGEGVFETGRSSIYVVLPSGSDVDAHYARALAAGAQPFREPEDADYGGRGYSVTDPEGNYWSFGTYDPWVAASS